MRICRVLQSVFVLALLAGCAPDSAPPEEQARRAEAACAQQHPYPCGGEWPEGLTGPFQLATVDDVQITMDDGTVLAGWVAFPTTPGNVRLPTVLTSSTYYDSTAGGTGYRNPKSGLVAPELGAKSWWDETTPPSFDVVTHSAGFPPIRLIQEGYALAYVSVRGTGASEGCLDMSGELDQVDQRAIIDWIASRHWSNGRVGMVGLSGPSAFSWMAATQAPTALKTIVTAGDVTDWYQWTHSPQGARSTLADAYLGYWWASQSLLGGSVEGRPVPTRAGCEGWSFLAQDTESLATGDRNEAFWLARPRSTQLGQVTAAVLDTSGYFDLPGHAMQDSMVWGSLPRKTPRVQVRGWWGHRHPTSYNDFGTKLDFPSGEVQWEDYVIDWLGYWLKGIGPEPRTGLVYHQDQNEKWHEATNWSDRSSKEVLYLSPEGLATTPGTGTTSFQSAPHPLEAAWLTYFPYSQGSQVEPTNEGMTPGLCSTLLDASLSHVYETQPLDAPVLVAGNPFAYVKLSSDQPGGLVNLSLYDLEPGFDCIGSRSVRARYIASGAADLQFYATPYLAHDFPIATPTDIRIDLSDVTYRLEPGHKLALIVHNGGPYERGGSLYTPNITIDGVSELVVPVVEGTLGGERPKTKYPQRPFTPAGYED